MKEEKKSKKKIINRSKKSIFFGLICFVFAFLCVIVVFYFLVNMQMKKAQEFDTLQEKVDILNAERNVAERKAIDLESLSGRAFDLEKLLVTANKVYGNEEVERKEGTMWIDQEMGVFVVTLGALNGLVPGSRLTVYDGTEQVGFVRVKTPMDVISYVIPVSQAAGQFEKDYYKVIIEE